MNRLLLAGCLAIFLSLGACREEDKASTDREINSMMQWVTTISTALIGFVIGILVGKRSVARSFEGCA